MAPSKPFNFSFPPFSPSATAASPSSSQAPPTATRPQSRRSPQAPSHRRSRSKQILLGTLSLSSYCCTPAHAFDGTYKVVAVNGNATPVAVNKAAAPVLTPPAASPSSAAFSHEAFTVTGISGIEVITPGPASPTAPTRAPSSPAAYSADCDCSEPVALPEVAKPTADIIVPIVLGGQTYINTIPASEFDPVPVPTMSALVVPVPVVPETVRSVAPSIPPPESVVRATTPAVTTVVSEPSVPAVASATRPLPYSETQQPSVPATPATTINFFSTLSLLPSSRPLTASASPSELPTTLLQSTIPSNSLSQVQVSSTARATPSAVPSSNALSSSSEPASTISTPPPSSSPTPSSSSLPTSSASSTPTTSSTLSTTQSTSTTSSASTSSEAPTSSSAQPPASTRSAPEPGSTLAPPNTGINAGSRSSGGPLPPALLLLLPLLPPLGWSLAAGSFVLEAGVELPWS